MIEETIPYYDPDISLIKLDIPDATDVARNSKRDLIGCWKADYGRTDDDYEIENPDSRALYEMIQKQAEIIDKLKEVVEHLAT